MALKPQLTPADFVRAAAALNCEAAAIRAFAQKESSGSGFVRGILLKVRFEGHKFREFTQGRFDKIAPTLSHRYMPDCPYNTGTVGDWRRLEAARKLAGDVAFECASYGMFQIMGFHYQLLGYPSAYAMVQAFSESEGKQLDGFVCFIQKQGLAPALRAKNFVLLADRYNGSDSESNHYAEDIQALYDQFSAHPLA